LIFTELRTIKHSEVAVIPLKTKSLSVFIILNT